jgi:DNA polymerase III alpha subunit (gram-positive type)
MSKYICKNCNTTQDAKHIKAMTKAGFGIQHLACSDCGQHMIADNQHIYWRGDEIADVED